jgi:hypothetical protein
MSEQVRQSRLRKGRRFMNHNWAFERRMDGAAAAPSVTMLTATMLMDYECLRLY